MQQAVIYARFSSSAQREESIDTQVRECTAFAKQQGYEVIHVYADHAKSGRTANRPEFQRMIKEASCGRFQAVILYTLDRFARNRLDSALYKAKLKKSGVRILYAKQPISEEPEGIILESVMEGYAEYYSASLARSVKGGMKENALHAKSTGGTFPMGYTRNPDGSFSIVPVEAKVVRRAFELYAQHTSKAEIARILNREGYRKRDGSLFQKRSFDVMLRNPKYYGLYKYDDVTVENGMPPIITRELFEKVQKVLDETSKSKARYKAQEDYLLSNRVYCGCCRSPMIGESGTSHTGKVYRYYKCSARKKTKTACTKKQESKEALERVVVSTVADKVLTDENIELIADKALAIIEREAAENTAKIALEARLKEVDKSIGNLMKALETGLISETVTNRIADLEKERKTIEKDIVLLDMQTPHLTREQIMYWLYRYKKRNVPTADYDRFIVEALINRVYVSDTADGTELTVIINLSEHNTIKISGSDFEAMVHHTRQYPNQIIPYPQFGVVAITTCI